jgi:segregation and condensation protein A
MNDAPLETVIPEKTESPILDETAVRDPDRFIGHRVQLRIFEGPLDLLLYLIRGHRADIFDISIHEVTTQFIASLQTLDELEKADDAGAARVDIEKAGDFCVTAATLMQIKSRMLLPKNESANEDEVEEDEDDPRRELVERLLEYQRMQGAAVALEEMRDERSLLLSRPAFPPEQSVPPDAVQQVGSTPDADAAALLKDVSTFDLLRALSRVLQKLDERPTALVRREPFTLVERSRDILTRLKSGQPHDFETLCDDCQSRLEIVVTFLAVLELVRRGRAQIRQRSAFDEIWIEAKAAAEAKTAA